MTHELNLTRKLRRIALAVGLSVYAASLKAWLVMTGDRLQLVKFSTE